MRVVAANRKALFDYEVLERFVAGIVLIGAEVKALRQGKANLKGSFIHITQNTPHIINLHISPYQAGNQPGYEPTRKRKLLLKGKEISYLIGAGERAGHTLIPLEIYFKGNLAKVTIGLCKSRKRYDKRELLKKRSQLREMRKIIHHG